MEKPAFEFSISDFSRFLSVGLSEKTRLPGGGLQMRFITLTLYESVKGHFKGHKGSDQIGCLVWFFRYLSGLNPDCLLDEMRYSYLEV